MTTIAQAVHVASLPPAAARAFLRECCMADNERERHLYITGRTVEAAQAAQLIESEDAKILELTEERDDLKKDVERVERELHDTEATLETAEEKVLTLESELENAQDEIKALRREIHEAGVDLL